MSVYGKWSCRNYYYAWLKCLLAIFSWYSRNIGDELYRKQELEVNSWDVYRNVIVELVVTLQGHSTWQRSDEFPLSHDVQVLVRQHFEVDCLSGAHFRHLTSQGGSYLVLSDFGGHLINMCTSHLQFIFFTMFTSSTVVLFTGNRFASDSHSVGVLVLGTWSQYRLGLTPIRLQSTTPYGAPSGRDRNFGLILFSQCSLVQFGDSFTEPLPTFFLTRNLWNIPKFASYRQPRSVF